uniref:Interferon regulatory factor 3 n=1 Tax=Gopherus evgoodei TaxID=1825980 RepID=A0A8C4WQL5_9SAUR
MGTPKPLIVPWLRRKLDEGCYPGVRWLDQGRTQFRVPWKHGLRQDASTEDFQLFRDWAIDSGSYRPDHDAPAPSVWKRNFRSALNRKPGIQVLRDHSSDSADPHKIYEILPKGGRGGADEAPSAAVGGTEADASSQLLDKSGGGFSSSQDEELDDILNALALSSPDEDAPGPARAPGASYASDAATGGALSLGFGDFPPLEPAPSSLEQLLGSNVLMTFFEVRVYYRGHLVLQTLVSNPQGFRLVPPSPGPSPYPELADVVLPEPGMLPDWVQASYTARLLQGLGAGVRLQVEGPALCATRLGRLHAYWGRTETPEPGAEGGELSKEGCTPLYDLPRFVRGTGKREPPKGCGGGALWGPLPPHLADDPPFAPRAHLLHGGAGQLPHLRAVALPGGGLAGHGALLEKETHHGAGGAHSPADPAPAEPGWGGVLAAGGGAGPAHLGLAGGGRAAGGPAGLGGADGEPALRLAGRSRSPSQPNPGVRDRALGFTHLVCTIRPLWGGAAWFSEPHGARKAKDQLLQALVHPRQVSPRPPGHLPRPGRRRTFLTPLGRFSSRSAVPEGEGVASCPALWGSENNGPPAGVFVAAFQATSSPNVTHAGLPLPSALGDRTWTRDSSRGLTGAVRNDRTPGGGILHQAINKSGFKFCLFLSVKITPSNHATFTDFGHLFQNTGRHVRR